MSYILINATADCGQYFSSSCLTLKLVDKDSGVNGVSFMGKYGAIMLYSG
jgi:hypothetical protein